MPEPWLRNTLIEVPAVSRQVLHALELTAEDTARWTAPVTEEELHASPFGLPSLAFHLRHIARSLDRLLTYAEGHPLSPAQLQALQTEDILAPAALIREEFARALANAAARILALPLETYEHIRHVGRDRLPTSVGGLLVHCADHTQRHTGQLVTTAKLILALRAGN